MISTYILLELFSAMPLTLYHRFHFHLIRDVAVKMHVLVDKFTATKNSLLTAAATTTA
jgi:hypothetical protein